MDEVRVATASHRGRRPDNQDAVRALQFESVKRHRCYLLLVADGMGGASAGGFAAETAAEAMSLIAQSQLPGAEITSQVARRVLQDGFQRAHEDILSASAGDATRAGMGTTMVAAVLWGSQFIVANVGDSRAYLIDSGDITQLTVDHSAVAEMLARGEVPPEQAQSSPLAHALTRCLGDCDRSLDVDIFPSDGAFELSCGQVLLLCSDGLRGGLYDDSVHEWICGMPDLGTSAEALVRAAWHAGSTDNISVALLERGTLPRRPGRCAMPPRISRSPLSGPQPARGLRPVAAGLGVLLLALGSATLWVSRRGSELPAGPEGWAQPGSSAPGEAGGLVPDSQPGVAPPDSGAPADSSASADSLPSAVPEEEGL